MMKFTHQYDKDSPTIVMTIRNPDATLQHVLEQFEYFLRAVGYSFEGTVDIVEEEISVKKDKKHV